MSERALPVWQAGTPTEAGVYIGFSAHPERDDASSIYHWDGKLWRHYSGWYDHCVTHWMKSDIVSATPSQEPTHEAD